MKQKDQDEEILKNLNEQLENVNKAISIWGDLLISGKYPKDECLNEIKTKVYEKILILKMIKSYDTGQKR